MKLCKCGCGQICKKEYIQWHHRRGKPSSNKGRHQKAWNKGIPQTEEQRKKNSESKKGRTAWNKGVLLQERSNFWLGGTKITYSPGMTEEIREVIRDRDNRKCQICNADEKTLSRKMEVHHIDFKGNDHSFGNLISLCRQCHLKVHKEKSKKKEALHGNHLI